MCLRNVKVAFSKVNLLARNCLILGKARSKLAQGGCSRLRENNDVIGIGKVADFMHRRAALNVTSLLPKISLSRAFDRYSAAITNRVGEIGSPCLSPRVDLKKPKGAPLMRIENQHDPTHRSIREIHAPKDLKKKRPLDAVIGLRHVNFYHNIWGW